MSDQRTLKIITGGGPSASGFGFGLKSALLAVLFLLTGSGGVSAGTDSDSVESLRQLVEQQNRKIEALVGELQRLEDREKQRDTAPAAWLPAIVIDTNGLPISSPASVASAAVPGVGVTNPPVALLSAGANGFSLQSADTNFVLNLHGLVQADARSFFKDDPYSQANGGFLLRRARPIFTGTLFRDFDFMVAPDFGVPAIQLYDASITYHYQPWLQLTFGKFKGPVDLEDLQTDAAVPFSEHSLASDLAPLRNLGFQMSGELGAGRGSLSWAAGVYNCVGDSSLSANSVVDNNLEFGGRLFLEPFKADDASPLHGLGFGVGGSYSGVVSNGVALPSALSGSAPGYLTTGQQQFFAYNPLYGTVVANGPHWRLSPQMTDYLGPFGLEAEYMISDQSVLNNDTLRSARLENTAWQVSGQWVLTGENASFNAITPRHPFDPRAGHWGAWQLVARYSELDLDQTVFNGFSDGTTSAGKAAAWSAGLNWWLNRNVRILTSFSQTTLQGGGGVNLGVPSTQGPPATVAHQDEYVLFTRVQVAF